jgi:AraC family transcriptional regulator
MPTQDSRAEYAARMHRVIEAIDRNIDQTLDLDRLAAVAHFSPFHFHRLFTAWTGETLGDYVRRRRIELAAVHLIAQPRVPVLQIALGVGFGSGEAFARAFKQRYGCSASAWRALQAAQRTKKSNPGQVNSKHSKAAPASLAEHDGSRRLNQENSMEVTIIDRPPATIAYFRHLGPYGETVARFWQETYVPWAIMNKLGPDHARYGISHDDPGVTAPAQCRYDACAEVSPDFVATGGALKTTIPGGKYAVLRFQGTVAEIGEAWTGLLRDWLPASGYQMDSRPCFEYYPRGATYDANTGVFSCEICVPVVPL